MTKKFTRVIIIAKSRILRENFVLRINGMQEFVIVNSHTAYKSALKNLERECPQIILIDIDSDEKDEGINVIRKIKKALPSAVTIVLTHKEESEKMFKALSAGVNGFIKANASETMLHAAMVEASKGGAPLTKRIARMLVESLQKNVDTPLTSRETEVLSKLARGKSYRAIADDLFIHRETVKTHIKNIYGKLKVNNKADAIEIALKQRLI